MHPNNLKDSRGYRRRRQWHPTPVLLPGKFHGRRSLVGCSPWVAQSRTRPSDFTFTFHFHALEEMATHSSVLAWRIAGTGEPGGLPSMGSHRVRHDWSDLAAAEATEYLVSVVINVSLRQTGASRASQKMILQSPITMKEGSVKVAFLLQDRSKSFSPRENSKCNSFELLKSLM